MKYEYDLFIGIILVTILLFVAIAILIEKLFKKNKISKGLKKAAEWVADNCLRV